MAAFRDWVGIAARGLGLGASQPVLEPGVANPCVVSGDEGALARGDPEVARVRVGDHLAWIIAPSQSLTA